MADLEAVEEVAAGLYRIDVLEDGQPGRSCAYLVRGREGAALVETGSVPQVEVLLDGMERAGFDPARLDWIFVTHVHLDHAGAAGTLLRLLRRPTLLVHPRGVRHMVDPSRLYESARSVYGTELLERVFGRLTPAPEERVREVHEGERLDLGGRELRFLETPGHARHHACAVDSESAGLFSGDAAGIFSPELSPAGDDLILPTTTPNQFDPETMAATCRRLAGEGLRRIYYTHFGPGRIDPAEALERNARLALEWAEVGRRALEEAGVRASRDLERATRVVAAALRDWIVRYAEEHGFLRPDDGSRPIAVDLPLDAMGIADYWARREAEAAAG